MKYFILGLASIIFSCGQKPNDCTDLDRMQSGFNLEDHAICDSNLQNQDNTIYIKNLKVLYEINYLTNEGSYDGFIPILTDHLYNSWELMGEDSVTVKYLELEVTGGVINECQTEIKYRYLSDTDKEIFHEKTGLVENCRNIWIHNPRFHLMQRIYIGIWPYFPLPLEVGKTWEYGWKFGDMISNRMHITWEGTLDTKSTYIVKAKETLLLNGEKYETYVVNASFTHDLKTYESTFYFSDVYGILKQVYEFPDGDVLSLSGVLVEK